MPKRAVTDCIYCGTSGFVNLKTHWIDNPECKKVYTRDSHRKHYVPKVTEPKVCPFCASVLAGTQTAHHKDRLECRRAYQRAANHKHYEPKLSPGEIKDRTCKGCGCLSSSPFKYGYCKRNPECERRREQVRSNGVAIDYHPPCPVCYEPMRRGLARKGMETGLFSCTRTPACKNYQVRQRARQAKAECLIAYGGLRCVCCGETNLLHLQLDHVFGDGHMERRRDGGQRSQGASPYSVLRSQGYPDKHRYQVLCGCCNFAKGVNEVCPCLGGKFSPLPPDPNQMTLF